LEAPIDTAALLARCLGNTDLVSRLLKAFEPEIGKDLQRLEQAFRAGNGGEVADFAHAIKGSAANLSADALASLARELENAARHGEWQSRGELIEGIRNEFHRCLEALPALSATV
jgi:HPt (histidine-containing phosphotransfer) domain-containing protein